MNTEFMYLTADKIGISSGGGLVTAQESEALKSLGPIEVFSRDELVGGSDPWGWDEVAHRMLFASKSSPKLCHIYSGTFSKTVSLLQERGVKSTITVAAHDVEISRREHLALGLPFNFPHLNDVNLFQRYIGGYKQADVVITPGSVPEQTMRKQGITNRIEVIPHGCFMPKERKPLPQSFRLGYMGSYGADKGVKYLLEAWKKLDYKDGILVLAGRDSLHPWVGNLIEKYGGGKVVRIGWVNDVADFYNSLSCYCQPSATEGFGIEITEAMSFGRPVLCSKGAGAVDLVPEQWRFPACDSNALAEKIEFFRRVPHLHNTLSEWCYKQAANYMWDKIKERYITLWKSLL